MRGRAGRLRAWCAAVLVLATAVTGPAPVPGSPAVGVAAEGHPGRSIPPWKWPLGTFHVVARPFDPPAQRWLPGHRGVDLFGVLGEPVRAVDDGIVTFSGEVAGVGVVAVTHAGGLRSTYRPVADRVVEGVPVARGQRLGVVDADGHCLLLHCLHLGAVRGRDQYLDPSLLLGAVRLTLLPLGPRST